MSVLNNKCDIICLIRKFWDRAKDTKAVLCGNRLPLFKSYEYGGIISQELIEKEPQRWIIPECLEAGLMHALFQPCQILYIALRTFDR